jgi:hypothetical protein
LTHKKYLKKVRSTETEQPVKLLVETIYPIYSSGKYQAEIEDMMSKAALKGLDYCDSRAKVFLPLHCLQYLADSKNDKELRIFSKYLFAEMSQVNAIQLKRNFEFEKDGKINPVKTKDTPGNRYDIIYMSKGYHEEFDDMEDDVLPYVDKWIENLDALYDDKEFHVLMYNKFLRSMNICVVALTNLMLQNDCELTVNDVVPFSFAFLSFCYLTLVVHWGEGTSIGE